MGRRKGGGVEEEHGLLPHREKRLLVLESFSHLPAAQPPHVYLFTKKLVSQLHPRKDAKERCCCTVVQDLECV